MSIVLPLCVLLLIVIVSCKHEIPVNTTVIIPPGGGGGTGGGSSTNNGTCSPDSVYYKNVIEPLIVSGCTQAGCHNATSHASGVILTSYSQIAAYTIAGNASASKLYKVLIKTGSERMPLPPLPAFTSTQIALVQKWINQGAKNNACNACDSTNFKYSTAVQPMMQTSCVGCHSQSNAGGGIDLSTYSLVKTVALNGKLLGSIMHNAGYSPMPKGGSKMSDCEIAQIRKWIDAGSLNN